MIPIERCSGCNDDFYNGRQNFDGGTRCWSAEGGRIVTRFRIGTWTTPDTKGAFTEVEVPSCYRAKGQHFYEKLPSFVKAEDVVRRKRATP